MDVMDPYPKHRERNQNTTITVSHDLQVQGETLAAGTYGFHVGYPQGRPGEAASRLMARSNLISRASGKSSSR